LNAYEDDSDIQGLIIFLVVWRTLYSRPMCIQLCYYCHVTCH